jgi:RHH-type proline utilization regulon transcriptional repressor/proline dehydrogenase/delta 1-pyrroline-5-carboxylate dehydrogenase
MKQGPIARRKQASTSAKARGLHQTRHLMNMRAMDSVHPEQVAPARQRLEQWRDNPWPSAAWPLLAAELAQELLVASSREITPAEENKYAELARMLHDENGKAFVALFADRIFRSENPERIVEQIVRLIERFGVPSFFSAFDKIQLSALKSFAKFPMVASIAVPMIMSKLREETADLIIRGDNDPLNAHLERRSEESVRMNCNRLGEAILSHAEADARLDIYLEDLKNPRIDYISVKISSVCAQISLLAWDDSFTRITDRLRRLYRAAMANPVVEGTKSRAKFVNLDMEEYRDLKLTVAVFRHVLSEPEFRNLSAGIVLQAYIPDSFEYQKELTNWAVDRFESGGAPIKIRIVKGANLQMEQLEADRHHWEQAPYDNKCDVDANYKRMLEYGCLARHAHAVHLGIASHNLFDIAYAMILRTAYNVEDFCEFEMLEGMATHQRRAVQQITRNILLYGPLARSDDFRSAIAYLVRRLDENTAEGNFLRHIFDLKVGSPAWVAQKKAFLAACERAKTVPSAPRRTQDRRLPIDESSIVTGAFINESDTDWTLPHNREWIREKLEALKQAPKIEVAAQIAGEDIFAGQTHIDGFDPSRPGIVPYVWAAVDLEAAERALACADAARASWGQVSLSERSKILAQCAVELRRRRGELIAVMTLDGGKAVWEADAEHSEAVDFAEYYRRGLDEFIGLEGIELTPRGIALITPPWNFPMAIPCGGILAALMAGNPVILKPPTETVLVARKMVECLWDAGVPKEVLQFVPCQDDPVGTKLVRDPRIQIVILTGATSTAQLFSSWRPEFDLYAETGGKNAIVVSAVADIDIAIKDILHSAFGHNGQKCSAASLAIVEAEIYDHPDFARRLREAAETLPVGSAWDFKNIVTPLIHPPHGPLEQALTSNDGKETWLLEPSVDPKNPRLWRPGIKMGVEPYSFYHQNECFGPVLGVVRAENFEKAVEIANQTPYGLTAGLHSLDEREQEYWAERIAAGNIYINRSTTGAIVQRQPFGGWKASNFGPGAKAGGPNYVLQMCRVNERRAPSILGEPRSSEVRKLVAELSPKLGDDAKLYRAAAQSYEHVYSTTFARWFDPSQVRGQDNVFRYRPARIAFRIAAGATSLDIARVATALKICKVPTLVSIDPLMESMAQTLLKGHFDFETHVEAQDALVARLANFDRVRIVGRCGDDLIQACARAGVYLARQQVYAHGRVELLTYLREQSLSAEVHRYGNLPPSSIWSAEMHNKKLDAN